MNYTEITFYFHNSQSFGPQLRARNIEYDLLQYPAYDAIPQFPVCMVAITSATTYHGTARLHTKKSCPQIDFAGMTDRNITLL